MDLIPAISLRKHRQGQWCASFMACVAIITLGFAADTMADDAGLAVSVTPHEQYSSSIGALGCKLNTDRVAYWPGSVSCNDFCIKIYNQGRSLHLLRIDTSGGAHDISYDAWNFLGFGKSAVEEPYEGGRIAMQYSVVPPSDCGHLLYEGKLPLSAANSMNFVASCIAEPTSWVAHNYVLYNIDDPQCKIGVDEKCHLDLAISNQPSCPSGLGIKTPLNYKVENTQYGTGQKVPA
ncbi:hypothetical protein FDECE_3475 [Fusarium decemcellulare]|nr:hypothetical protein FDECE_3475 [Fusarium decemcellulare]